MKSNIGKTARLKDKVTIAQEENYQTYGMVLCSVTLTDLQMRRAGLSASTELLVDVQIIYVFAIAEAQIVSLCKYATMTSY